MATSSQNPTEIHQMLIGDVTLKIVFQISEPDDHGKLRRMIGLCSPPKALVLKLGKIVQGVDLLDDVIHKIEPEDRDKIPDDDVKKYVIHGFQKNFVKIHAMLRELIHDFEYEEVTWLVIKEVRYDRVFFQGEGPSGKKPKVPTPPPEEYRSPYEEDENASAIGWYMFVDNDEIDIGAGIDSAILYLGCVRQGGDVGQTAVPS